MTYDCVWWRKPLAAISAKFPFAGSAYLFAYEDVTMTRGGGGASGLE